MKKQSNNTLLFIISAFTFLSISSFFIYSNLKHFIVNAQTGPRLAIMSDSTSDEYRANDNRAGGTQYAATTLSWGELLVNERNFSLGSWGTRTEPRRTGYEYNWARSGATARSVITTNAHTGIANQIQAGLIDVVYFQIGNNDFAYYNEGHNIYHGTIAGQALQTKIDNVIADITLALDTVLVANGETKVILGTIPDMGNTAYWRAQYPDPVKRQRVTAAVTEVNMAIMSLANSRSNVILFDLDAFGLSLLSSLDAQGNLVIGGELISVVANGYEPHHVILGDNIHGGTVIEGLQANEVILKINQALGTTVPIFSDQELLTNAGIIVPTSTPTATPVPTETPTPSPSHTPEPTPSITPEPTPTPGTGGEPTPTPSEIPTPTPTLTPSPSPTNTPSPTPSPTNTPTPTPSPTPSPTNTPSPTPSNTPVPTPTHTPVPTPTSTPLPTNTPTPAPTSTPTTVPTSTPAPAVTTHTPMAYQISGGSYISGSISALFTDDNVFFRTRSTTSGSPRVAQTEFGFNTLGNRNTITNMTINVRVKSSASSTSTRLYLYNFVSNVWEQKDSYTIGTAEVSRAITLTGNSNISKYVDPNGQFGIRVSTSRSANYEMYHELATVQITR